MMNFKTVIVDGVEYKLDRDTTIFLFRKMWSDMATDKQCLILENTPQDRYDAKRLWLDKHTNVAHSDKLINDCFLCQYDDTILINAHIKNLASYDDNACAFCPIDIDCDNYDKMLYSIVAALPEKPISNIEKEILEAMKNE